MDELKKLTNEKKELNSFYQLYLYCFKGKNSPERWKYFQYRYQHSLKYGVLEDGEIKSGLLSIPFEVNFHGIRYLMNGICDVASYPEFGGNGEVSNLIKQALKEMFENKVALSYLAPFSYDFYRRFGYEQLFDHCLYQLASKDFPRISVTESLGRLKRLSFEEALPFLDKLYAEDENNQKAGVIRSEWWWNYLTLKHLNWEVALYFDEKDDVGGYLIYELIDEKELPTFKVQEFYSKSEDGRRQLLHFIGQHRSMVEKFSYESSQPYPVVDFLREPRMLEISIKPYMMGRIVNLKVFIERYPFLKNVTGLKIAVKDSVLPENNGIWELSVQDGKVSFEKISKDFEIQADIMSSIQNLNQLFLGYHTGMQLYHRGSITGKKEVIKILDDSLIHDSPSLQDYF